MTDSAGVEKKAKQEPPEAEIVPSSVTKKADLTPLETQVEIAAMQSYWQHLAVDPQAQREVKEAMLARAAADTAATNGIASLHKASAESLLADAAVKKEAARKQRIDNDRAESLSEQNRIFARFALKYAVPGVSGFLFLLGGAEGIAGLVRIISGIGTINLTMTGGALALGLVVALTPTAIAALIGKIK